MSTRAAAQTTVPDLLQAIVASTLHDVEVRERERPRVLVEETAGERSPRPAAFEQALRRPDQINVIAECKRRSPSRGVLRHDYQATELAAVYHAAGAVAISVLTEPAFFDGALSDLEQVRATVELPLLRKDFVVTEYQVVEARAAGADAVLLIVAALTADELRRLLACAGDCGLAALVEVHDASELSLALDAGGTILGVNHRNLRTLEVSLDASHALIEQMPSSVVAVAESGLRTREDLLELRRIGFDAFLVGEALVTHADPGARLRELVGSGSVGSRGERHAETTGRSAGIR